MFELSYNSTRGVISTLHRCNFIRSQGDLPSLIIHRNHSSPSLNSATHPGQSHLTSNVCEKQADSDMKVLHTQVSAWLSSSVSGSGLFWNCVQFDVGFDAFVFLPLSVWLASPVHLCIYTPPLSLSPCLFASSLHLVCFVSWVCACCVQTAVALGLKTFQFV